MRIENNTPNVKNVEKLNAGDVFTLTECGEDFYILTMKGKTDEITGKPLFIAVRLSDGYVNEIAKGRTAYPVNAKVVIE